MNRFLRWFAVALCAAIVLAPAAFGQTTTGAISGLVTAQADGSALPGAQVTATHEPTSTRYSTVTGSDGRFRLLNVRVGGPYSVTAEMDGFHNQSADGVHVQLGEDANLKFQLQLASVAETVIVVGESTPLINSGRTGAASNVSTEALENLPTIDRNFNDFARTNPFFTIGSENEDPDAISVAGRSSRYNSISIDGSVNNDLFGLADTGTPGGQSGTTPISLDAIQELELVIADFDVRNGGFSGGGINAVTRSGSNSWKGSVFYYTRDRDLFGDGPDQLGTFGVFDEDQYGFRLGGPISKDKIFFFINADVEDRVTASGWSIDGATGQQFAGGVGGLIDEANRFRNVLINNYGFDPGGLAENPRDDPSDKYFGRVDFNLNDSHNLTVRHNFVEAARDINRPDSETYEFPSETYDFQTETNSTVLQLNSVFGANAFNEARVALQSIRDRRAGADGVRFPWVEVEDVDGSGDFEFEAGTEPFSTRNALDTDVLEIHNDFTWLKGNHTLTFGTHNELFSFDNLFVQNAFGSYEFDTLEDFEAGIVDRFRYTVIAPGQSDTQQFDVNQLGFYAGDEWAVKDNLTLTLGLRVDIPYFPDSPTFNPDALARFGFRTDDIPDGEQLWQPRFGFNWDIEGDGTSQLRGGAGIFAGRTPYVWISNTYARTGIEQLFVECTSNPPAFNPDPTTQDPSCGLDNPGGGEFNFIDPGFQFPQVARYNLAYDRQLPWWNLVASAELVYTDSIEEIDYANVALSQVGTTFDGRPEYDDGGDAFLIRNTSEGEATNFALKLEKPFSDGVWGFVSYAYNDAEVVNEGSSSRAVSNFSFNEAFDPNNTGVSTSDFQVEHRFNASLSYRFNRDKSYPTTVSMFYNHQSGRPFSWLMSSDGFGFGFASYNGDGSTGNDLAWVPANEGDVEVTNGTWAELDAFISANGVLDAARGGLTARNADQAPWTHSLDVHVAQEIPVGKGHLELTFDLINLGNLLDDDSGLVRYADFNAVTPWELEGFTSDGRPRLSLRNVVTGTEDLYRVHNVNSRWRGKIGIRYSF